MGLSTKNHARSKLNLQTIDNGEKDTAQTEIKTKK